MKNHPDINVLIATAALAAGLGCMGATEAAPKTSPGHAGAAHTTPPRAAPARAASAAPAAASVAASNSGPAATPIADACPAQLNVRQSLVEDVPGWTTMNQQASYPFARVAFFAGSPADTPLLVPTTEYKGRAGLHDTWDLPRRASGYWVSCRYGNTTAAISRKLDDSVDYCLADYDGRFITLVVKHWACGEKRLLATRSFKSSKPISKPTFPYRHGD
jgi:hypothetical protein